MTQMAEATSSDKELEITFPDGNVRTFPSGVSGKDIAESISKTPMVRLSLI